jgi:hypothetical protein
MTAAGQWLVRAVLAAGVVGIAAVHFDDQARTDPIELLLGRAATALRVAGFAVERHREGWAGTRAAGRRSLLARHPACAQPIVVEAMGALNPRRDDRLAYACLVITAVEWRRVWFGPDRPGAIHPHERSIP